MTCLKSIFYICSLIIGDESSGLARIGFVDYIEHLTTCHIQSYVMKQNIIQIKTEIDDIFLDSAMALGLLINELVTNSLKNGFTGDKKGLIRIQLRKVNEKFILRVIDNGVGFPGTIDYQNTRFAID